MKKRSTPPSMLYLDTAAEIAKLEALVCNAREIGAKMPDCPRRTWTSLAIDKWNKDIAALRLMPDRAPCGAYGRIQVLPDPSKGVGYARSTIATQNDRQEHIGFVAFEWYAWYDKARLAAPKKQWPAEPAPDYLESVGDIASVNTWRVHDPETGLEAFKNDTPDWVVDIARRQKWITRKIGEVCHVF